MMLAHPLLGVGPGNFYQNIEEYSPENPGRDAHNTLVRCGGELGIPGVTLLCVIILWAYQTLLRCMREATLLPSDAGGGLLWMSYGCLAALTAALAYGMTGTLVYTEYLWWLLTLPVCLQRALANELAVAAWAGGPEQFGSDGPVRGAEAEVPGRAAPIRWGSY